MTATSRSLPHEGAVSAPHEALTERARFDALYARWFPRVYRFAAARLGDPGLAEAATRAALSDAVRAGTFAAGDAAAPRLLAHARSCVERARAVHAFVT